MGIKIQAKQLWSGRLWVREIGKCYRLRFRQSCVTGETTPRYHVYCLLSTHQVADREEVVGKAMIARSQCSLLSNIATPWMPKTRGECIPRAKETAGLVEEEKVEVKLSTTELTPVPILCITLQQTASPNQRISMRTMPRYYKGGDICCKRNFPRKCEEFGESFNSRKKWKKHFSCTFKK